MKYEHVMLDMETLATTADAVIMSIGAVKFNLNGGIDDDAFYASISIDSNQDLGRRITEDTLIWWMDQTPAARAVFREPKQTVFDTLAAFSMWFDNPTACIWSNGSDFDIPMLAHAYKQCALETPWEFYNTRCVRTYKSLPFATGIQKPANDHNALRDAINQAKYIIAIHAAMMKKKEPA